MGLVQGVGEGVLRYGSDTDVETTVPRKWYREKEKKGEGGNEKGGGRSVEDFH